MVHLPPELGGDGEQEAHRIEACDWGENFLEVNPRTLHISLGDESGLVLQDVSGGVALELVYPLDADWLLPRRQIGEGPSVVLLD